MKKIYFILGVSLFAIEASATPQGALSYAGINTDPQTAAQIIANPDIVKKLQEAQKSNLPGASSIDPKKFLEEYQRAPNASSQEIAQNVLAPVIAAQLGLNPADAANNKAIKDVINLTGKAPTAVEVAAVKVLNNLNYPNPTIDQVNAVMQLQNAPLSIDDANINVNLIKSLLTLKGAPLNIANPTRDQLNAAYILKRTCNIDLPSVGELDGMIHLMNNANMNYFKNNDNQYLNEYVFNTYMYIKGETAAARNGFVANDLTEDNVRLGSLLMQNGRAGAGIHFAQPRKEQLTVFAYFKNNAFPAAGSASIEPTVQQMAMATDHLWNGLSVAERIAVQKYIVEKTKIKNNTTPIAVLMFDGNNGPDQNMFKVFSTSNGNPFTAHAIGVNNQAIGSQFPLNDAQVAAAPGLGRLQQGNLVAVFLDQNNQYILER